MTPPDDFRLCPDGVWRHMQYPRACVLILPGYGAYYLDAATGHWIPSKDPFREAEGRIHAEPSHGDTRAVH